MSNPKSAASFASVARKIYHPIGFKKGYNFTLYFIFAGALLGFVLARLQYLSIEGKYSAGSAPGEWYWMQSGYRKAGITLHLATILPAGLLVVFQFLPIIRYKALIIHRVNGYLAILLLLLSHVGAVMVVRRSFGGEIETQALVGLLVIITTVGAMMAYYNIKRLQIDEHRAWMLRTWFYAGSIITLRIIMIISALIISKVGTYYNVMPCEEISFMIDDQSKFASSYPQCLAVNGTVAGMTIVHAKFDSSPGVAAALGLTFGTAGWLALAIHAVGIEIYLRLTPRESERLRQVSYHRQLEAGLSHPGSSGLTADRWGDADAWKAPGNDVDIAVPKETTTQ